MPSTLEPRRTARPTAWTEAFGDGIRRDHRTTCPASTTRQAGHRCGCPFSFWQPSDGQGKRRRARVFGSLADARNAKSKAERAVRDRRELLSNQQAGIIAVPTLDTWFDTLMSRSWAHKRPATRQRRVYDYEKYLREPLGRHYLDRITPTVAEEWFYGLLEREGNRRCVQSAFETLQEMLNLAKRQHLIQHNPTSGIRYPTEGLAQREKRVLSLTQYRALLDHARNVSDRTLFRVMTEAGLRKGETIGLQIQDLNLDGGYIHVQRRYWWALDGTLDINLPKNGKKRIVAISDTCAADLREHVVDLGDVPPDTLLWSRCNHFTGYEPAPHTGSSITEKLRIAGRNAGILEKHERSWITPHVLRRTGASIAVTAGVSPLIARDQLGHAHLSTTEKHYLRLPELGALQGYGAVFE